MKNLISVVIPAYKRVDQTLDTINLLFGSRDLGKEFDLEIIVSDSTPDNELEIALQKEFNKRVIYTRPQIPGVATNKNQGASLATGEIFIFCDSDMEVEENTVLNTISSLRKHKTAAAIGGQVFWRTKEKDGVLDRPRPEDRMRKIENTTYAEAIYSRYMATYKKVFWDVGGYDDKVFNMRGEGSDLSIRYWRAGYPLVFDERITVHHVHDAPDSIALRISHPEWGIAKDLLILAYKYDMLDGEYENFKKTIEANFEKFGKENCFRFLQGIGKNIDFITQVKPILDQQRKEMRKLYDFKFLEIFSNKDLFEKCIKNAETILGTIRS
jgi:GT2 family glycosyltransferase